MLSLLRTRGDIVRHLGQIRYTTAGVRRNSSHAARRTPMDARVQSKLGENILVVSNDVRSNGHHGREATLFAARHEALEAHRPSDSL